MVESGYDDNVNYQEYDNDNYHDHDVNVNVNGQERDICPAGAGDGVERKVHGQRLHTRPSWIYCLRTYFHMKNLRYDDMRNLRYEDRQGKIQVGSYQTIVRI